LSKFHDPLVPSSVISHLNQKSIREPYLTKTYAISPPFDDVSLPRNYTCWNAEGLSVGGIEFDMVSVGGASMNPDQFSPAVLLWRLPKSEGGGLVWISVSISKIRNRIPDESCDSIT